MMATYLMYFGSVLQQSSPSPLVYAFLRDNPNHIPPATATNTHAPISPILENPEDWGAATAGAGLSLGKAGAGVTTAAVDSVAVASEL